MNYISRCFLLLSVFFAFNIFAVTGGATSGPQASNPSSEREYWLFVGNPGVGKSTIINALAGKTVAKAGLSAGHGLTTDFTIYEDLPNNRVYCDTPGLADTKMRERAAKQIEEGLKQNAKYKIFFVIQLNEARVRAEDVATFNTVMNAINLPHKPFSIIVNKLDFDEKELFAQDQLSKAEVFDALNSGVNKTQSVWFIDKSNKLKKKKIPFLELDENLYTFFKTREAIQINKEKVGEVKADELDKITKAFEDQMEQMRTTLEADKAKQAEIIKNLEKASEDMRKTFTEERIKAAEDRARAAEEMARTTAAISAAAAAGSRGPEIHTHHHDAPLCSIQ